MSALVLTVLGSLSTLTLVGLIPGLSWAYVSRRRAR